VLFRGGRLEALLLDVLWPLLAVEVDGDGVWLPLIWADTGVAAEFGVDKGAGIGPVGAMASGFSTSVAILRAELWCGSKK
jgi:hypothetical protein